MTCLLCSARQTGNIRGILPSAVFDGKIYGLPEHSAAFTVHSKSLILFCRCGNGKIIFSGGGNVIRAAVCDDEKYMADAIRKMAADFFRAKNIETVIEQFSSGKELLKYDKTIDILFLDIQMKDMDGMETARELRRRGFKGFLIFITVLKDTVFKSFEVQAYDYLVKPVEESRFEKTMERLLTSMRSAAEENLLIQRGYESRLVPFEDIVFCEIIDRKIYLHLATLEIIDYYDRLEKLETKLDGRFFKCHRSFLINLQYLRGYKNGTAYMKGGKEIPVSRLRSKEFSGVILRYMKERRL